MIPKEDGLSEGCHQQAAVGPRGSGGTLNIVYSAGEWLKAPVPSESWMNMILWYRLVGVWSGCSCRVSCRSLLLVVVAQVLHPLCFYGHHGDDNSGRVSGLHVVRGRQSPPIWTRTVTGEAGENGQSSGAVSDRRARIRPSVTSGEIGTLYRIG